jgi:hypothetical protein
MAVKEVPRLSVIDMLVNELGTIPQIMASPVTMAGTGQITMPLEINLTSDVVMPILEFGVTLKMTSPADSPSTVLSNIRSITVEHEAFRDQNGNPKVYTLDTATLLDGALVATALMSDPLMKSDTVYAAIDPEVAGQASDPETTTYTARVALPFKVPAGKFKVTLNCQDISYRGTILDFTARRAILICPRREIAATGCYIACDSRRISGLSTFAFDKAAQMFIAVGRASVNGGILDKVSSANPNGYGQAAQIGEMTLTQVTENVTYFSSRLVNSDVEMAICIDQPIPRINRPTQMTLSLFRYDVYY